MVRPLGRQLHLRHRRGAAGAGSHRRGYERSLISAVPATGWLRANRPMAAGAKAAPPTWTPRSSGRGTATASQTAWALMALIAANRAEDREAIERGSPVPGRDAERAAPGTSRNIPAPAFPATASARRSRSTIQLLPNVLMQGPELSRAFMLRYGLYRQYFPLMALGRALLPHKPAAAATETAGASDSAAAAGPNQGPELSRAFMLRWDLYRQYFPIVALGRSLRKHRA